MKPSNWTSKDLIGQGFWPNDLAAVWALRCMRSSFKMKNHWDFAVRLWVAHCTGSPPWMWHGVIVKEKKKNPESVTPAKEETHFLLPVLPSVKSWVRVQLWCVRCSQTHELSWSRLHASACWSSRCNVLWIWLKCGFRAASRAGGLGWIQMTLSPRWLWSTKRHYILFPRRVWWSKCWKTLTDVPRVFLSPPCIWNHTCSVAFREPRLSVIRRVHVGSHFHFSSSIISFSMFQNVSPPMYFHKLWALMAWRVTHR